MKLTERFHRWRATKGYGVHSPLAFRLIQRVVRPPRDVVFYGEEKLEDFQLPRTMIRRARILLRFVAEQQPSYVWTSPGLPEIYSEAIRLAGCVIRIYDGALFPDDISKADMVVFNDGKIKKSELRKILVPGKSLIAFGVRPKVLEWTAQLLNGGIMLEAVDSMIAVCTRDEASHLYKISKL